MLQENEKVLHKCVSKPLPKTQTESWQPFCQAVSDLLESCSLKERENQIELLKNIELNASLRTLIG